MVSPHIANMLERIREYPASNFEAGSEDALITVNKLTSSTGTYYEKLRYLLDNKEEHLIRRSAIERIIRRRVLIEQHGDVGLVLLRELVSGGYLQNDTIPERCARDIQRIVSRYLIVRDVMREKGQLRGEAASFILGLAATEVERFLFPAFAGDLAANAMYQTVRESVQTSHSLTPEELGMQTYIATRRILLREDDTALAYALWLRAEPEWQSTTTDAQVTAIAERAYARLSRIRTQLRHPLNYQLMPRLRNHSIYFSIIAEIVEKYGVESGRMFENPEDLDEVVRGMLKEKYSEQLGTARKSGLRSVGYVLATKTILAFLIELPYDLFVLGTIHYTALATNIVFHPTLLFMMTRTIGAPDDANTRAILDGIHDAIEGRAGKPIVVKRKGIRSLLDAVFLLLYAGLFVASFGALIWVLELLRFNIASLFLFLFFLTLVTYLGLRIRYNARRWQVETGTEGTFTLLWNLFTLPLVRVGRWLNHNFSSVNVFVFLMDFIIETPFKLLLQVLDAFMNFLREKREETYHV